MLVRVYFKDRGTIDIEPELSHPTKEEIEKYVQDIWVKGVSQKVGYIENSSGYSTGYTVFYPPHDIKKIEVY